jgi:Plasma-membrane choline transporter
MADDADENRGSQQQTDRGGWFGGDDSEKLVAPADFDGPTVDRHCTDVLCAAFLLASWIVMTGIGIYAMINGNIDYLIRPLDFDGGICGTNYNNLDRRDYPYLLYVNEFAGGVCVKECPNLMGIAEDGLTDVRTLVTYGGLWQTSGYEIDLSAETPPIEIADYSNSSDALFCSEDVCFPNNSTEDSWTSAGINKGFGFAFYAATTYELLFRCYLTSDAEEQLMMLTGANTTETENSGGFIDDVYSFWNKLFADLYLARNYIFGFGCGVSLIVSLIYIFLMRLPVLLTTVVWTSIVVTILMFVLGGYYAWSQASAWADENPQTVDDQTINVTTGFSFALYGIAGVLILLACCLRRAIMDAIVCTKEAGRAVNTMTIILLVPVLQAIGFFLFMLPFVYYSANLASLATITTKDVPVGVEIPGLTGQQPEIAYRVFEFDDFTENCGWYFLFCFFWTGNFVVAMGDVSKKFAFISFLHKPRFLNLAWLHSVDYCFSRIKVVLYEG